MLLGFQETLNLLKKYNIPYANSRIISTEKELFDLKFPVALKAGDILHKTEAKAVVTNISNKQELVKEYKRLKKISKQIIIQEMKQGHKVIMGAKQDPVFGPILLFGTGGIFAEILNDVCFRLAPVNKKEVEAMIKEIKGYSILKGYRGQKKAKIKDLERILLSLSDLIINESVREIDLNPVIVNSAEAVVVDVKILI